MRAIVLRTIEQLTRSGLGQLPQLCSESTAGTANLGRLVAEPAGIALRSVYTGPQGWDITLPSRAGLFKDAAEVLSFFPNRNLVEAQFSPHGLQLVPKSILSPKASTSQPAAPQPPARALNSVQQQDEGDAGSVDSMLLMDMTRVWRRLKMKKHKIRKRRKANRYKVDK
ncbi:hypothetical protein QJQ45_029503 [Haematococcus lacustris]|nr:hypothetical protein QJQ45_029503 [Haematococcus lacustris]